MRSRLLLWGYVLLCLGPFALGLAYSLGYSLGLIGPLSSGFTTAYWSQPAVLKAMLSSLGYTVGLALVSLLLATALALLTSFTLCRGSHSPRLLFALLPPMLMPPLVAALAWYYLLSPTGIGSRVLWHTGVIAGWQHMPILVHDPLGIAILVTHVFLIFPLFTWVFYALSRKERLRSLLDLSRNLGASHRFFFTSVYAPLLLRRAAPLLLLYGIFLLGTYEVPLLLGRSYPQAVAVFISDRSMRYDLTQLPLGHAMAALYTIASGVVAVVVLRKPLQSLL